MPQSDSTGERPSDDRSSIRSVATALRVLEVMDGQEALGVTEIARRLGLPKASAQRVLMTLGNEGWIRPAADGQTRWLPAERLIVFASRLYRRDSLRAAALPVMEELRDRTQESVSLLLPRSNHLVIIDRLESPQQLRVHSEVGSFISYVTSAAGKAVLAHMPDADIEQLVRDEPGLETHRAAGRVPDLVVELEEVRRQGFSINRGEWRDQVAAGIGAAILDEAGRPSAGLALAIPSVRFDSQGALELGALVAASAARIGLRLRSGATT